MKHCFNCGREVDREDYEQIGHQRLWVCGEAPCQREMRAELRAAEDEAHEAVREEFGGRW